jgi:hypothetical protein
MAFVKAHGTTEADHLTEVEHWFSTMPGR